VPVVEGGECGKATNYDGPMELALSLFIAGACAAQTSNATADQTTRNGGPWILMAADADGASASAYLTNTATGDTYNCSASYLWIWSS
jgi:hypothetical protein